MSKYAYAAVAAADTAEEQPEDWPDGWTWPPEDSGGVYPPGWASGTAFFSNPSPTNGSQAVEPDANFSWVFSCVIAGATYPASSFKVLIDDVPVGTTSSASFDPGAVASGTHTWRVIAYVGTIKYVGPEWSFTTVLALSGSTSFTCNAESALLIDIVMHLGAEEVSFSVDADPAYCTTYDPPAAPTDAAVAWAEGVGTSPFYKATITWTDNSSNEGGFHAQYSYNGSTWGELNGWNEDQISANLTTKKSLSGLNGMNDLYGRIRAWRTADGITVYSAWSVSQRIDPKGPW